jgi:hypothetical protein
MLPHLYPYSYYLACTVFSTYLDSLVRKYWLVWRRLSREHAEISEVHPIQFLSSEATEFDIRLLALGLMSNEFF